jgi:protein-tyrosine phosphatase
MTKVLVENFSMFNYENRLTVDVDMHTHILPFHDNGPNIFEEAIEMCDMLVKLGFRYCIATPHIMKEYYENSEEKIIETTRVLSEKLAEESIDLRLRPAAEYYIDQDFLLKLKSNKRLLTLDDKDYHVLIETAFVNEFDFLVHTIRRLQTYGYQPVMAHPEKFSYLYETDKKILKLKEMNVKFQVNMSSYLSSNIRSTRENLTYLVENELIDFVGSNIHSFHAATELFSIKENPIFQKTLKVGVQNGNLRF